MHHGRTEWRDVIGGAFVTLCADSNAFTHLEPPVEQSPKPPRGRCQTPGHLQLVVLRPDSSFNNRDFTDFHGLPLVAIHPAAAAAVVAILYPSPPTIKRTTTKLKQAEASRSTPSNSYRKNTRLFSVSGSRRSASGEPPLHTLAVRAVAPQIPSQQTVIVQRPASTNLAPRTFLIGAGISLACWHIYWSTVLNPFFRHVDREYEKLSPAEKKALDEEIAQEDAEPWFIPFPFTTKSVNQPPYKGSDPEWLEFVKLSKQKGTQTQIRADLANWVKSSVERHPVITARCGNSVRLRRYWLDIDFPYRPPPVFYSSGLLLQGDGLYWSTQPVDSLTVKRLQKILWPDAIAVSSWAFTSALLKQHYMDISRALGFESSKPVQTFPSVNGGNMQQKTQGPLPSANRQTPDGTPAENASHNVSKTTDSSQADEPESGGKTNFVRDTAISHIEGMKQITDGPAREFRRKLAQSWKPTRPSPPRGCILVSGFVECELPKGFVLIDVWGFWNPKTETFETKSTFMNHHPLIDRGSSGTLFWFVNEHSTGYSKRVSVCSIPRYHRRAQKRAWGKTVERSNEFPCVSYNALFLFCKSFSLEILLGVTWSPANLLRDELPGSREKDQVGVRSLVIRRSFCILLQEYGLSTTRLRATEQSAGTQIGAAGKQEWESAPEVSFS
ncbi:uncharacterized protein CLUP02_13107 [Colletotrichum lupini]|uniref:Uncharacterized protein n=1 Tax=Colletotrichum lupini TaxID=145971 RepID=A0A9Q8WM08_9PEZI|nr:uncharacterized protein CLUP02_13107 [Colletotrichum lupini]UQC87590.1 hypothetical protein CLUP02_13107 [Colletotrichum lupini]